MELGWAGLSLGMTGEASSAVWGPQVLSDEDKRQTKNMMLHGLDDGMNCCRK